MLRYLSNEMQYWEPPIEAQVKDAGEYVEFRIRDHGAGVPPDFVHRLFGKFACGSTTPRAVG